MTRREPLEEPLVPASRFEMGGGPLTSVASLFATHLRVETKPMRANRPAQEAPQRRSRILREIAAREGRRRPGTPSGATKRREGGRLRSPSPRQAGSRWAAGLSRHGLALCDNLRVWTEPKRRRPAAQGSRGGPFRILRESAFNRLLRGASCTTRRTKRSARARR